MEETRIIRYVIYLLVILHATLGCQIDGIDANQPIVIVSILDIARSEIFRGSTTDIIGITNQAHGGDLPNRPPYLNAYMDNSEFVLAVNENFENYEEYETRLDMSYTVTFSCQGTPNFRNLIFNIQIQDTNNHEPQFLPTNEFLFIIHPPLPPNFLITGCSDQILVRDVDLTTTAINFAIEDNDYLEILPDADSNVPNSKEFKGLVRTKTLIRSISEPLTLWISATDVDNTGDPPHTVFGTIVIEATDEFEVPDDLVFTETYYMATYTEEHSVILDGTLSLQQGFDEEVDFILSGDLREHFTLTGTGNSRSLAVASPLPTNILNENSQVFLIITADRNLVTPTTATIVINLPQAVSIAFQELHYEGTITDNVLILQELTLEEGYHNGFNVEIISDYRSSFTYSINNDNVIILSMTPLEQSVLELNSYISLQVEATSSTSTATTLVTLNIIKDDTSTPVFQNINYVGTYDPSTGLELPDIVLIQGYDNTVEFLKDEEHGRYFYLSNDDNVVLLTANIPPEVLESEQQLMFTVHAAKERTVGATTTVIINLPPATIIAFEELHYEGHITDNILTVPELKLEQGYQNGFTVEIVSEYMSSFTYSINNDNEIILSMTPLEQSVLEQNSYISLQVEATSSTSTATTLVTLNIIKDDTTTPVFENINYVGTYDYYGLELPDIVLIQGYDNTVEFSKDEEYGRYFDYTTNDNIISFTANIPPEILENENQLVFTVHAAKVRTVGASTTIIVNLPQESFPSTVLRFESSNYRGSIIDNTVQLDPIILVDGYSDEIEFELSGDHDTLFRINEDNAPSLTLELIGSIPNTIEDIIVLEIRSYGEDAISAYTTIILDTNLETADITLGFDKDFYTGTFTEELGLATETITLEQGFDEFVQFRLDGEQSTWFTFTNADNVLTIEVLPPGIPDVVLANNLHLTFTIIAERTGAVATTATIVIAVPDDLSSRTILRFGQSNYRGSVVDDAVILDFIVLTEGYTNGIGFELSGDHDTLFRINEDNAPSLSLELIGSIPNTIENVIVLELRSYGEDAISAYTTIILDTNLERADITLGFDKDFYTGTFTEELGLATETITLDQGFDELVQFRLDGEQSTWFTFTNADNAVTIEVLSPGIPDVVLANNLHLTFTIIAERTGAVATTATIVIAVPDDLSSRTILRFGQSNYRGSVVDDAVTLDFIVLTEGYTNGIGFELSGDHETLFRINEDNAPSLSLELIGSIPNTIENVIVLELRSYGEDAISAYTTIILDTNLETADITLGFDKDFYTGTFTEELGIATETITLEQGFDELVQFRLDGEQSTWFTFTNADNVVTIEVLPPGIPDVVLANNLHLTFTIIAERTGAVATTATIVIAVPDGSISEVYFDRALYNGVYDSEELSHDDIRLIGFSGTTVNIHGEWSDLFMGNVDAGVVTVIVPVGITLPLDLNFVTLELSADTARTALVIDINHPDIPLPPTVEFNPTFYVFDVDITQTGLIGRVQATINNGENLLYSLQIDNENLSERLIINPEGELHLSAPAPSGQYSFVVEARTEQSGVSATANAQLTVNAVTICGENHVVPPLIIIERNEEEAHENLVVLDDDSSGNCYFTLTNRWPESQQWLTVDERGLHAAVIDREDESIAFMPVSQVQVELVLHCDTDELSRKPRSIQPNDNFTKSNDLGPYDYGSNKWILTDTILYNSRRSFVNLIVNDINDNPPIFNGKENEPIVVGYPVSELVEFVLPRALAIVQATDADIGENARLVYWSDEPHLAVARETGAVHIRNNMQNEIQDNLQLTISATDRSGAEDGLTGNIALLVRLLDVHNIIIVTIRDAFLDDENKILQDISQSLGYDVKSLRATVISDYVPEDNSRLLHKYKRDILYDTKNVNDIGGAALQLYIYALSNDVPIDADDLIEDIDESDISTISITSIITLEDLIEDIRGNGSSDTALFAATITLSVLVFSLIVFIILWYIFKVRKANNYDEFTDLLENSIVSENPSVDLPKAESMTRERKVNIDEIKRSERRLQEMLNAPIHEIMTEPLSPVVTEENANNTIIDVMSSENNAAIIIQSIDKLKDAASDSEVEDEFGEVVNEKRRKRKSVVTFNENVEKIIHVEDNIDDTDSVPDVEIERF